MAKDRRIKGCPNINCICNHKKRQYEPDDNFCVKCGTPLVFVCKECFRKLSDEGPGHVICRQCEAEKLDRKSSFSKQLEKVGGDIAEGAKKAGDAVGKAAKTAGDGISQAAKSAVEGAGELQFKMQQSVQEGMAKGFQKAMEKAEEKKRNPDVVYVDDTDGKNK